MGASLLPDRRGRRLSGLRKAKLLSVGGRRFEVELAGAVALGVAVHPHVKAAAVLRLHAEAEGVAAVEPDIRGATTIRKQLAKHRDVPSCASCHTKIDPPGFALESFDVIGGWRDYYRTSGNGKEVKIDGRRMPYLQGPKVDPADVMADGQKFRDIDEFKQLLLKDKDQLARALTEKLVTYATGAAPQLGDQKEIDAIVGRIRERDYGTRALVHEVVQSRLFLHK